MKLYKFSFSTYRSDVRKEVIDVEEKPKTYIATGKPWKSRINKSDIGRVNMYNNVYLLKDNEQKARELYCEKLRSDIHTEKERIESANKRISECENLIKDLLQEGQHGL